MIGNFPTVLMNLDNAFKSQKCQCGILCVKLTSMSLIFVGYSIPFCMSNLKTYLSLLEHNVYKGKGRPKECIKLEKEEEEEEVKRERITTKEGREREGDFAC